MKIKTAGALLALCITGVFSMHAGAATIDNEFANDANSYTVTLSEDSDISSVIQITDGKDVTLDLNGHTLTPAAKTGFYVNGAAFTITDNSANKNGTINFANEPDLSTYKACIYAVNSTLALENAGIKYSYQGELPNSGLYPPVALIETENSSITLNDSSIIFNATAKYRNIYCLNTYASNIKIANSTLNAVGAQESIAINAFGGGDIVITNNSSIESDLFGLVVAANPDTDDLKTSSFLMDSGSVSAPMCSFGMPEANITGGTFDGYLISGDSGTLNISGGEFNGDFMTDDSSKISISGGSFVTELDDSYLAPGYKTETDESGNITVKKSAIYTGSAVTAQGVNGTTATGFVTTISSVESISSISWAVTGNGATKSTKVFEVGNVGGEGDVKIGLIIDGLDDSAAVAKATVNGTINE